MGTQIGAYRVVRQIGEGGMGSVWLAEHSALGRCAAIKVLHPSFSTRPDIVTRFFNEARAATAISDPGIVQIFDFGHHIDGSAYIVMELLDGETLDQRVRRVGRLPISDALRILRQVASSLGAAHARGIVHRDLKPENVFLVRDPEVIGGERAKILDFGIAKLTGDNSNIKTHTSAVMGTPTYMSPEQCRGAGLVDQRSDIYSLGCVLFAVIVGRPPFDAEGAGDLIAMHLREQAPLASSLRADVPVAVDQLIARCLAKDPGQRFEDASQLAQALDAVRMASSPGQLQPAHSSQGFVASASPTTLSAASGASVVPDRRRKARAGLVVGVVGTVAAVTVVAVVVAMQGAGNSDRGEKATSAPVTAAASPVPNRPAAPPPPVPHAPVPRSPTPDDRELGRAMKQQLVRFFEWSSSHAGAACPALGDLGTPILDPWGHAFSLTCTDQPANQVVGVISAGPDGSPDTADDVASWNDRELADTVRGGRWKVAPPPPVAAVKKPSAPARKQAKPGVLLDENGIPVNR